MLRSILLIILILIAYPMAQASPVGMEPRGQATFRYLGLPLYEARLFTPGAAPLDWGADLHLELTYLRNLSRDDLVAGTLQELQRLGHDLPARGDLERCFQNVAPGDQFAATTMGRDAIRFQMNAGAGCTLSHPGIAPAFMSIFLGDYTRSARFSRTLRGE
jgi:hypothetical protein